MWGASGSSAVTIARKSSKECIGYRPHVAGPERHQHVAGFEMPVQLPDRLVQVRRPHRPDPRRGQRRRQALGPRAARRPVLVDDQHPVGLGELGGRRPGAVADRSGPVRGAEPPAAEDLAGDRQGLGHGPGPGGLVVHQGNTPIAPA